MVLINANYCALLLFGSGEAYNAERRLIWCLPRGYCKNVDEAEVTFHLPEAELCQSKQNPMIRKFLHRKKLTLQLL